MICINRKVFQVFVCIFLSLNIVDLQGQFGRVLSSNQSIMREMDLGPRILNDYDSLAISVKQIEPVDYKLQNKSSHVIRTNWNNDLFTVNQWQLFDCKKNEINDSSNKLLFGGNLAPIIIPFKNNQFKLININI